MISYKKKGWIDGELVMIETLLSIRRAGPYVILTYFAKNMAKMIKKKLKSHGKAE